MNIADPRNLRAKLRRLDHGPDYFEIDSGFARGSPQARTRVFEKIEEFLNVYLYNYRVKVGEPKEVK